MIAVKVPKWCNNFLLVWVKWSEVLKSTGKFVSLLPLSLYSSFCSLLHLQSKERWKKQIGSVLFVSWFSQLHFVPWIFQISVFFRKPNIPSAVYLPLPSTFTLILQYVFSVRGKIFALSRLQFSIFSLNRKLLKAKISLQAKLRKPH